MKATVFIPTYNGEKYLKRILTMLFKQETDFEYEVLIIDSGSKDGTLDIIRSFQAKHANLRLHEIPNSEYGHGRTRNLGAQMANGEIIAFLSHDAVPASKWWLTEIVKPFDLMPEVKGVVGRQTPQPKCVPLLKYEIAAVFKGQGAMHGITLYSKNIKPFNNDIFNEITFYSDVNSATRRDFLVNEMPLHDVPYAEDYMFGKDIVNAGYIKAYAGSANVVHSNDISLREYKHRIFDETVGVRRLQIPIEKPSYKAMVKMFIIGSLRDGARTILDREYSFKRKVFWFITNPLYHIEKLRGIRLATSVDVSDQLIYDKYSLEKRRNT